MRVHLLAFILSIVGGQSFGIDNAPFSRQINAATNTIPTSYSTAAGSLVFVVPPSSKHIKLINETTCSLAVNAFYQNSVPSNTDSHNMYSGSTTVMKGFISDDIYVGGTMYLRSNCGSPITTGTVTIEVW